MPHLTRLKHFVTCRPCLPVACRESVVLSWPRDRHWHTCIALARCRVQRKIFEPFSPFLTGGQVSGVSNMQSKDGVMDYFRSHATQKSD